MRKVSGSILVLFMYLGEYDKNVTSSGCGGKHQEASITNYHIIERSWHQVIKSYFHVFGGVVREIVQNLNRFQKVWGDDNVAERISCYFSSWMYHLLTRKLALNLFIWFGCRMYRHWCGWSGSCACVRCRSKWYCKIVSLRLLSSLQILIVISNFAAFGGALWTCYTACVMSPMRRKLLKNFYRSQPSILDVILNTFLNYILINKKKIKKKKK